MDHFVESINSRLPRSTKDQRRRDLNFWSRTICSSSRDVEFRQKELGTHSIRREAIIRYTPNSGSAELELKKNPPIIC